MSSKFPELRKGQMPSRQHFNRINNAAQRFTNIFDRNGDLVGYRLPPWHQLVLEVTEEGVNGEDDWYYGKIILYSFTDDEWKDEETQEWLIDVGAFGDNEVLITGDRVTCFWDRQRGAFIPTYCPDIRWAKLNEDLVVGGSAGVSIYNGGPTVSDLTDTGRDITVGAPPLQDDTISSGEWVLIEKIGGYWWVTGAPCA